MNSTVESSLKFRSSYCMCTYMCSILYLAVACKKIMSIFDGNFHKVLLKLIDSPHKEVQYNCAGIIGHLAMNGELYYFSCCCLTCIMWLWTPWNKDTSKIRTTGCGPINQDNFIGCLKCINFIHRGVSLCFIGRLSICSWLSV